MFRNESGFVVCQNDDDDGGDDDDGDVDFRERWIREQ